MCCFRTLASVIAVLVGAVALAAEPVPRGEQRFPNFSWDTIPLYMHVRKATAFTDEELDYLTSFPLVTLEKTTEAEHIAKGITAVQQAARSGKIIAMTLGLGESAADETKIDDSRGRVDELAAMEDRVNYLIGLFLVCTERYSYLYLHDGYSADSRRGEYQSKVWLKQFPQYDRPLGAPLGPATRDGLVYTRRFEHVDVMVDLETKHATLEWRPPGETAKQSR